jgi:hypothetical protein
MKRFGILLIVAMFGLVLACGSKEEEKPKRAAPPAQGEKVTPQAPPATPAPPAPEHPKAEQPKPEHPKGEQPKPEHPK